MDRFLKRKQWTPIFINSIGRYSFFRFGFSDFLLGQLTLPPVFIIDDENQNIWEMINSKIYKHKFQFLINWVKPALTGNFSKTWPVFATF